MERDMARVTLHEKISDDLRQRIALGEWRDGEVIPTEVELAKAYGVSRPTVRQAIQKLVAEGRLERRRRRGTVVRTPKIDQSFTLTLRNFDDTMIANNRVPRTKVLMLKRERANAEVRRVLSLSEGAVVFKLVRVRYADDVPNLINVSYIPADLAPTFDEYDYEERSMYAVLREIGCQVVSAKRHLEVAGANTTQAHILDVSEGDPIYIFKTIGTLGDGTPIEYSLAAYRGESNSFEFAIGPDVG